MFVVKIYSSTFSTTPVDTTYEFDSCKIKQEIKNFDTCEISLPINYSYITQYQKVQVCEIVGTSDIPVFTGYVYSITITEDNVRLFLRDQKALLQRKAIVNDVTYSSQTISNMVNSVLTQWNTPYSETWTASVTASATTYTQSFKQGDSLYQAIESICNLENLQWKVSDGVVTVATTIGEDKTSGANYTEAVYSRYNPIESNVSKIVLETTGMISNIIVGSNGAIKDIQTDSTSISTFGPLYEYIQFRDGSLTTQTQKYLSEQKNDRRVWKIQPNIGELSANVGDKIVLRVEGFSTGTDTTSTVNVISKEINYKAGKKIEILQISDNIIQSDSFFDKFRKLQNQTLLSSL